MIRRLLVGVVAVVTALAAGIALGGGPLSDIGRTPSQAAPAPTESSDPVAEARAGFADAFAGGVAAQVYAGRLGGKTVAIVTLPGADPERVEQLGVEIVAAGGEVTGTYALKRTLVDVGDKTLVDTLGVQVVEQLGEDVVTPDATTYDRAGQLIGRAVATTKPEKSLPAAKVASLRASLQGARLVGLPDGEPGLASLVLVITGGDVEPLVLDGLVSGLAAAAVGVVVAGPTADEGIAGLRADPPARPVATIDGIEAPAGRVVTTLALVHALAATGGAYGASGADGPVPLG